MTKEDAIKLVQIVQYADGGCSHCVTAMMNHVAETWPDIDWRPLFNEHATDGGTWRERNAE